MAYQAGFLRDRVQILKKSDPAQTQFGATTQYEPVACVWASVTWTKGLRALREGSLDAYDTVMVRMAWNDIVTRDCRLQHDGTTYQIQSLHRDRYKNEIQITATEVI